MGGVPALGVIRPIENEPSCTNAGCHAHPASKRLLGVLDVTLLLPRVEQARRQTAMLMVGATGGALLLVVGVMVLVVRRSVHRPIRSLTRTLAALGTGDYSARYENGEISEFAYLGNSVNKMAQELQRANAELVEWAQTLERRVEEDRLAAADGLRTSRRPCSSIANTPISLTAPKRFLTARITRKRLPESLSK